MLFSGLVGFLLYYPLTISVRSGYEFQQAETPLTQAVDEIDDISKLELILSQSPELVTHTNVFGQTPLQIAARQGRSDAVRLLLKHGADPNPNPSPIDNGSDVVSLTESTPLYLAIMSHDLETVIALVVAGADTDRTSRSGESAVQVSRELGTDEITQFLLSRDNTGGRTDEP